MNEGERPRGNLCILLLVCGGGGSGSLQTGFLLLLRLGSVLIEKLEQLCGGVLVEGVRKLSDRGWDLESLVQDDLLALQADVFGPLDEAGHVPCGLNILAWIDWCL